MFKNTTQDFLRGDRRTQLRTLVLAGTASLTVLALGVAGTFWAYPRISSPAGTHIQAVVSAVGPGIEPGAKVLLRGAEIGEVTDLTPLDSGGVTVGMLLRDSSQLGTDFEIDFRPENYFGVSAINLTSGPSGARDLVDGHTLDKGAPNDFTMSTMLEQGSLVVDGTLTSSVIQTLDEVTRYADGLSPLVESGVLLANNVSRTQAQLPSLFLGRFNNLLTELPAFNREVTGALFTMYRSVYNRLPNGEFGIDEALLDNTDETLALLGSDLFGLAGTLLASHDVRLTPLTQVVEQLSDPVPGLLGGGATFDATISAIDRLESAFSGTESQRTLQVRVMLDRLPAISGALASTGTMPSGGQ